MEKEAPTTQTNRVTIFRVLQKEWVDRFGTISPKQFDFLTDSAQIIAAKVPHGTVLSDAEGMSPEEILQSDEVQDAELTNEHRSQVPWARRVGDEPTNRGHNGAMKAVGYGIAGVILSLIIMALSGAF